MRFLSFEQWMQSNPMPPLKLCPFCDGDGRHECDCGHQHACDECHGSGKRGDEETALAEHRERYEAEKEAIMAKLSAWRVQ